MSQYRYYVGDHNGRRITLASKSAKITCALLIQIKGVKGVSLIDGFATERKARNYAAREGWDLNAITVIPVHPDVVDNDKEN